jgi:hypothetical protein
MNDRKKIIADSDAEMQPAVGLPVEQWRNIADPRPGTTGSVL